MTNINQNFSEIIKRRTDFPSLNRIHNGYPIAYLDGPGGTQVPQQVIDEMVKYYTTCNANHDGKFVTSVESDRIIEESRQSMAVMLNAESGNNISFGANMTTLTFSLSKAIGRMFKPGEEILITQLDHEANRGPWLNLRENGIVVREVKLNADGILDYDDFKNKINKKTRLVSMGLASNALGTVNNIPLIKELADQVGAWLLIDAVHFVPHFPVNLKELDVDFFLCSAYKFYGPHVGILYSKTGLLDQMSTDRLRTQIQRSPFMIETGTLNHAALAGVNAAVEYIASFGTGNDLRTKAVSAMKHIYSYEHTLATCLYQSLINMEGVKVYGPAFNEPLRAPTISFTLDGMKPVEICSFLNEKGICVWDGHFYAIRPVEVLGLLEKGGLTRAGISLYNTQEEIDRFLEGIHELITTHRK
jgi:cysteine desulfurase family protein (TIGR01976 family)